MPSALLPGADFPKIVQFIGKDIFVLSNEGALLAVDESMHVRRVFQDDSLKSYAVMVSEGNNCILLAGLNGGVKLLNPDTGVVHFDRVVVEGKIFAAALFREKFLINGPDGVLLLFPTTGDCRQLGQGTLPEAKQRWFAVAKDWKRFLLLGDRVGSVHLYNTDDLTLMQSFRKLHGRNGVTDIQTHRDGCLRVCY